MPRLLALALALALALSVGLLGRVQGLAPSPRRAPEATPLTGVWRRPATPTPTAAAAAGGPGLRGRLGGRLQTLSAAGGGGGGLNEDAAPMKQPHQATTTWAQAASLLVLMLQNTSLAIFMRLSRKGETSELYVSSTAVCFVELFKVVVSLVLYLIVEKGSLLTAAKSLSSLKNWKFGIPAGLYVVQNNLQYIAMTSLPANIYQLFIQLKIVAAAILSERLLPNRKHTRSQWSSILALTFGLGLVQLSLMSSTAAAGVGSGGIAAISSAALTVGLSAVLLSCITSGFAGVYSEKLVKSSESKLWDLNLQMSVFGLGLALAVAFKDFNRIRLNGSLFYGFNPVVWTTIALHAFGGLVIAFVVKNTSSVVKGFAQSGSVVLSSLISHFFLKDSPKSSPLFFLGSAIVCLSAVTFAASQPTPRRQESSK